MEFKFDEEFLINALARIASKKCNIPCVEAKNKIEETIWENGKGTFLTGDISEKKPAKFDYSNIPERFIQDWEQFIREEDILPNLKWIPSLHPLGCKAHEKYWNRIWSIRDSFWKKHHPYDCPDCLCDLSSTDEPVTN